MHAPTSAPSGGRDAKIIELLTTNLRKLDDFKNSAEAEEATTYAAAVVAAARAHNDTDDDFRDQIMAIVANLPNLNGELRAAEGGVAAAALAVMDASAMRSYQQKREMVAVHRKRAREQTNVDNTSLHCTKCGLVRRDRLNINELALDSEESGSHFDYNFDNVCTCSHSSDEDSGSSSDEDTADAKRNKTPSSSSSSSSSSDSDDSN